MPIFWVRKLDFCFKWNQTVKDGRAGKSMQVPSARHTAPTRKAPGAGLSGSEKITPNCLFPIRSLSFTLPKVFIFCHTVDNKPRCTVVEWLSKRWSSCKKGYICSWKRGRNLKRNQEKKYCFEGVLKRAGGRPTRDRKIRKKAGTGSREGTARGTTERLCWHRFDKICDSNCYAFKDGSWDEWL